AESVPVALLPVNVSTVMVLTPEVRMEGPAGSVIAYVAFACPPTLNVGTATAVELPSVTPPAAVRMPAAVSETVPAVTVLGTTSPKFSSVTPATARVIGEMTRAFAFAVALAEFAPCPYAFEAAKIVRNRAPRISFFIWFSEFVRSVIERRRTSPWEVPACVSGCLMILSRDYKEQPACPAAGPRRSALRRWRKRLERRGLHRNRALCEAPPST